MNDDDRPLARSSEDIAKSLMRRAWEGASKYSPQEMEDMIAERRERARRMPAEHALVLYEIDPGEPRSILALNLLEKQRILEEAEKNSADGTSGKPATFTRWTARRPGPGSGPG